jgi:hypothetical protein
MNSRFHEATKHEDEEEIDVDAVDLIRIKPIFIYFALLPVLPAVLVPVLQLLLSIGCFLKLNKTFPDAPEYETGCVILPRQDYGSSYCYDNGSFIMRLDQARVQNPWSGGAGFERSGAEGAERTAPTPLRSNYF